VIDSLAAAYGAELERAETAIRLFNPLRSLRIASLILAHVAKNAEEKRLSPLFELCAIGLGKEERSPPCLPDQGHLRSAAKSAKEFSEELSVDVAKVKARLSDGLMKWSRKIGDANRLAGGGHSGRCSAVC
jgi:hypothetical protein